MTITSETARMWSPSAHSAVHTLLPNYPEGHAALAAVLRNPHIFANMECAEKVEMIGIGGEPVMWVVQPVIPLALLEDRDEFNDLPRDMQFYIGEAENPNDLPIIAYQSLGLEQDEMPKQLHPTLWGWLRADETEQEQLRVIYTKLHSLIELLWV